MIVFASSITEPDTYRRCAEPGITRCAAEPDSEVMPTSAAGSLFRSYNLILDRVAERDDLEALVLVHQDAEIADPRVLRQAPRRRWPIRRSASSAASARSACAASPGGRGR